MKFKFAMGKVGLTSWYLTPSVRLGFWSHEKYDGGKGGWLGITFLKYDACITWNNDGKNVFKGNFSNTQ